MNSGEPNPPFLGHDIITERTERLKIVSGTNKISSLAKN